MRIASCTSSDEFGDTLELKWVVYLNSVIYRPLPVPFLISSPHALGLFSFFSVRPRPFLLLFLTTSAFSPSFPYDQGFFSWLFLKITLLALYLTTSASSPCFFHDISFSSCFFSRRRPFLLFSHDPVFGISAILVQIRIRGSLPLTSGRIQIVILFLSSLVSDHQSANKKLIFFYFFCLLGWYFLKVHLQR
jgi:hypothetical protein